METGQKISGFYLDSQLGRGGAGEVWSAHTTHGEPVAIKFITEERAVSASFRTAFRREIEALAALVHPNVVAILDHGTLRLNKSGVSIAPWFVMERASAGSLSRSELITNWRIARSILQDILAGLAHAHAHGIIHLDLKPSNVLLQSGSTLTAQLADFGIAHILATDIPTRRYIPGTPGFMAPEHTRGDWRALGPWTDLFSVGRLAQSMCTHQFPVPITLKTWISRCLQVDPKARFRHAADALWALNKLDTIHQVSLDSPSPPKAVTRTDNAPQPMLTPTSATLPRQLLKTRPWPTSKTAWQASLPSIPSQTSLSLFGLRAVPFVDRDGPRQQIWTALQAIHLGGKPRVFAIHGPSGTGKTQLAEWMGRRLSELGLATLLVARHEPVDGPMYGLKPALVRYFQSGDLTLEQTQRLLKNQGAEPSAASSIAPPNAIEFSPSVRERHVGYTRLFKHIATERPIIILIDDAHWASDALNWLQLMLSEASSIPSLVLLTIRDDILSERPQEAALIESILKNPHSEQVTIAPLDLTYQATLLRQLLPLSPGLDLTLAEQTDGSPMFAVQLLGDLIEREILKPGPTGFQLTTDAPLVIPHSIQSLWRERLISLGGQPEALELAATLGLIVNDQEWQAVCVSAGIDRGQLVNQLTTRGLATQTGGYWQFVHVQLQETICQQAQDAGRWASHNSRCADALATLYTDDPIMAERQAVHLQVAGRLADALAPLRIAIEHRVLIDDFPRAEQLLATSHKIADRLDRPTLDRDRVSLWFYRVILDREGGRMNQAIKWARRAIVATEPWPAEHARALNNFAQTQSGRRDVRAAAWAHEQAVVIATTIGDNSILANALFGLGQVLLRLGDLERAEHFLEQAESCLIDAPDPRIQGWCQRSLARIYRIQGDIKASTVALERAHTFFELGSSRLGTTACTNSLGEHARAQGRWNDAERYYRLSIEGRTAIGSAHRLVPQVNLGFLQLECRGPKVAQETFQTVAVEAERQGWELLILTAQSGLLACIEDPVEWDACAARVIERLNQMEFADSDVASMAQLAGQRWQKTEHYAQAQVAFKIALTQWARLGKDDKSAEVRDSIRTIRKHFEG